jgi:hypothetical protein
VCDDLRFLFFPEGSGGLISFARMLPQTSTHSLQIYTPGPAMSFFTSEWLFPQKEHMVRLDARAIF